MVRKPNKAQDLFYDFQLASDEEKAISDACDAADNRSSLLAIITTHIGRKI